MNYDQNKHYILGLEDAIKELQLELNKCNEEMSRGDAYWHWSSALKCSILSIKDLISKAEVGL